MARVEVKSSDKRETTWLLEIVVTQNGGPHKYRATFFYEGNAYVCVSESPLHSQHEVEKYLDRENINWRF